jgi:hypothetical protein
MRKTTLSAMLFIALIALVAVASAALPATVTATISHPGTVDSYWTVDITNGGNNDLPNSGPLYLGWCSDSQKFIGNPVSGVFTVYSSLSSNPAPISPANWRKINYVINHKNTWSLNKYEVQTLVWKYDGGMPASGWWDSVPAGSLNMAHVTNAMNDADAYIAANPTYTPQAGEVYGVVLIKSESVQSIFIEVPIPHTSPEFPTFGLPVAMLLGVVFTIYSVKKRDE